MYKKYSEVTDLEWLSSTDAVDLVDALARHLDLTVEVATWEEPKVKYISAEKLANAEWEIANETVLSDGTRMKVLRQGEDYSEVDPGSNPMGVVFEFNYPTGPPRYLEIFGHYVSHDGGYWDGYHEVWPKTVTVNTFEGV